ncbi:Protein of unknown function [Cotesia congregata]|uniref:Uncharacterized protein n=1 Tax=Cotesia congregata TaxID=51543 RepID=A0A8J2H8G4_COTCN|nr:Protein of unknown function [Cotesia congregata]
MTVFKSRCKGERCCYCCCRIGYLRQRRYVPAFTCLDNSLSSDSKLLSTALKPRVSNIITQLREQVTVVEDVKEVVANRANQTQTWVEASLALLSELSEVEGILLMVHVISLGVDQEEEEEEEENKMENEKGRTSRASSTSSLGREVRCGCQYFKSDSLLPERRAMMMLSRPSSRASAKTQPGINKLLAHVYRVFRALTDFVIGLLSNAVNMDVGSLGYSPASRSYLRSARAL